jgi:uncharacterized membrane protein (DUF2068 family)
MREHPLRDANDSLEHALHLDARRKLRVVALIDVVKGVSILAIGLGILGANSHVLEHGGAALLRAADSEHGLLSLAAAAYASLRFIEAYGLWRLRGWARWLGLVSAGLYVPFELYYLVRQPSLTSAGVLAINLAVLWLLWPNRRRPSPIPSA